MTLKYKCLILDHDDTAVDSTASIHHPSHLETMRQLRPDATPIDLEGWFKKNFDPGIMEFLEEELCFTENEREQSLAIWRKYARSHTPRFYPGFIEILKDFKSQGGLVTVVSHSEVENIAAHYRHADPTGLSFPDKIFGWDMDPEKRKPNPYPVIQILTQFNLKPEEALIVDDLKPGVEMAQASGVSIAAAGWGHRIPEIRSYMESQCLAYLADVEGLRRMVL